MPKDAKKDIALLRVKYAAYRREQTADPDKVTKTLGFKAWVKQNSKKSE